MIVFFKTSLTPNPVEPIAPKKTEEKNPILSIFNEIIHKMQKFPANTIELLEKTYTSDLPDPTPFHCNSQNTLILWRGMTVRQLFEMVQEGSAGGEPANVNASSPSETEAIEQVAEISTLPEFTHLKSVAESFGTNNIVAAVRIKNIYLTLGSVIEGGQIAKKNAPIQLLAWKLGEVYKA